MPAPGREPLDAAKGGMRALEQLEAMIPGFSGYKEKELRREADRLLRDALVSELEETSSAIDDAYGDITSAKIASAYPAMNTAAAMMDRIIGRVQSDDYGYAGFFDAVKVKEAELDSLYAFDKALFDDAAALSGKVEALEAAVDSGDAKAVGEKAAELRKALDALDLKLNKRKSVMMGLA
ncbi:MAG: hypothetical protein PHF51_03520 [Candidatus ainarchaeum sp.]|nr:hypothetical protein [Candidatus ainarchaeum sp.]